jgi:hypothetical protein
MANRPTTEADDCPELYSCPHCRVELENVNDGWSGWRLCPACGRPLLPPWPGRWTPTVSEESIEGRVADGAGQSPAKEEAIRGKSGAIRSRQASRAGRRRWIRMGLSIALAVSLLAVVVTWIRRNELGLAIFSLASLVEFLVLVRLSLRR